MRSKEKSTRIIFVRHGKTDFPLDRIYCDDREDPALNQLGISQANSAASALADIELAAIFASPSLRTRMTAGIIAEKHDLAVEFKSELMERRFGYWEGMYFHEIEAQYPDEYMNWKRNNAAFQPEGGESVFDLQARLSPCVTELVESFKGQAVVVVSHVGPIRATIASAVELSLEKYRSLTIDYASISIVDYGRSQNNLICLNRVWSVVSRNFFR